MAQRSGRLGQMLKDLECSDQVISSGKIALVHKGIGGCRVAIDRFRIKTAVSQQATKQAISTTKIKDGLQPKDFGGNQYESMIAKNALSGPGVCISQIGAFICLR